MASDNRQQQKYACGVQLLTTGWPNALPPADREYMVGWLLSGAAVHARKGLHQRPQRARDEALVGGAEHGPSDDPTGQQLLLHDDAFDF